jgi:hypothetical protein
VQNFAEVSSLLVVVAAFLIIGAPAPNTLLSHVVNSNACNRCSWRHPIAGLTSFKFVKFGISAITKASSRSLGASLPRLMRARSYKSRDLFAAHSLEFIRNILLHMQVTVFAVFVSFVIRAVYQTIFALSNGLNTYNPVFSPCDDKNQSIWVVINAVLTCVVALLFLSALTRKWSDTQRCRYRPEARFLVNLLTGPVTLVVIVSLRAGGAVLNPKPVSPTSCCVHAL